MAEFAWNNHHHSSLEMMPFFTNYGMHLTMTDLPLISQYGTPKRIKRILESQEQIREQLLKAQEQQVCQYDKKRDQEPEFKVGEKVYLSTGNLITNEGPKKLSNLRLGAFTVLKKVGEGACKLRLLPHMKVNPTFNVSLLMQHKPDLIIGGAPSEPAPVIAGDMRNMSSRSSLTPIGWGSISNIRSLMKDMEKNMMNGCSGMTSLRTWAKKALKTLKRNFMWSILRPKDILTL